MAMLTFLHCQNWRYSYQSIQLQFQTPRQICTCVNIDPVIKFRWGKVMFLRVSVILFTGGSASVYAGIPHPWDHTPHPWEQTTPWDQATPRSSYPPTPRSRHPPGTRHHHRDQAPPPSRAVNAGRYGQQAATILLECILVSI